MTQAGPTPRIVTDVPRLPPRPPEMHKGQAGCVAIIAGSRGMSGAACLAGLAALRGGAGLVRIYCPASIQPVVAASEPCLMTVPLADGPDGRVAATPALEQLRDDRDWPQAVAVGPGLGQESGLGEFVRGVLQLFACPVVIDADGLNNLALAAATQPWWTVRADRPTIVTPHPGEMARLRRGAGLPDRPVSDEDQTRVATAAEFARLTGATVVLKGHRTIVSTADQAYINTTGNPGMATGGMGDVLTGLLAALLGQGLSAFDASRLAVYCHGAAADLLAKQIAPFGYLAREVADGLPPVLAQASRPPMGFKSP